MAANALHLALSPELASALRALANRRGEAEDHVVEVLLREHPVVQDQVARSRERRESLTMRRGRSLEKLILLGRAADRVWSERLASGQVSLHAR